MAKLKTPMGMPISKTNELVTNFKALEIMAKFNVEAMTNGVEHLPVTCSPITTPPLNVNVSEDSHFNELEDLGSLNPISDKENMQVLLNPTCIFISLSNANCQSAFPLVIASDSENIPSTTKFAKVSKPSLVLTSMPRLPREVNGSSFYASSVKQKPSVSNLGSKKL
jgi:hypothetical protein